jgi:hypothetical protein
MGTYRSMVKGYERWCAVRLLRPWPTDEILISSWILHLGTTVSVASIPGYVSACKFVQPLVCSSPWSCDGSVMIRQVLRHMKKLYGVSGKGSKYAICMATLRRILPLLPGWPDAQAMSHDDVMFACASLIATCTFLRGGEFTTHNGSTREVLRGKDVRVSVFNGRETVITAIPRPKNAWWSPFVEARCFDSGEAGPFSPVLWLRNYRERSEVALTDEGPAFQTAGGLTLTRDFMVNKTNVLFELAGIFMLDEDGRSMPTKASSWRAGGARSATLAGLSGPMIMALGRWKSIAWGAYVAYSLSDLESAAQQMWSVSVTATTEAALPGGVVPQRFQDDAFDEEYLRSQFAHRRAGSSSAVRPSASRQCG